MLRRNRCFRGPEDIFVVKAVFNSDWVRFLDDRLLKFPKQPSRHARECARQIAMRTVSPGETVTKSINRLIVKENLTVTDDADGSLVIMEPTWSGYLAATLKTGENILSGSARFDRSKSFSHLGDERKRIKAIRNKQRLQTRFGAM